MRARKLAIRILLSLTVSGVFVGFSLRHTDARAVLAAIAAADPSILAGYFGVLLAVHLVRTWRWQLLLAPLGRVGFRRVNSASAVGFMLLAILPLRLGELGRPLLVSRPQKGGGVRLARTGALASCLVERVIDCLAIGVLGIVSLHVLATTGSAAEHARLASVVVTAAFAALCVMLTFAFLMRERTVALVRRWGRLLSARLADKAAHMLDNFIRGLHLGSAWSLLGVLALTAIHWALHVLGFWMVARAFGLPLTVLMATTVLASNVVGVMIPAGPGMVGTSQFFTQLGVSIFIPHAFDDPRLAANTAAYANAIWMLQFGQAVLLGLVFVLAGHVALGGLFSSAEGEAEAAPPGPAHGDAKPESTALSAPPG
jgi:uncharacterized protein (TIRG00374 family)